MMTMSETKHNLKEMIDSLQSSRYHEGWINRHQFTLVVEAAFHHNPENRKYAAQAIRLGEDQFGRDWNNRDEVYYYEPEQSSAMRTVLANMAENL